MRNKVMAAVLTISALLVLVAGGFNAVLLWHVENRDDTIKVGLDGDGETVEFHDLGMHPGESCEFDLAITHEVEGRCALTLDFIDSTPAQITNNLKNYVKIIIIFNGSVIYEDDLAKAIDAELAPIECELDDKKPVEMKIIYLMPIDVGNEAENAETFIDLSITASNEG